MVSSKRACPSTWSPYRRRIGLKVDEFAALCGMSRATFHRKKAAKAKLGVWSPTWLRAMRRY